MFTAARYCICSISKACRLSRVGGRVLNTAKAQSSLASAIAFSLRPNVGHRRYTTFGAPEDLPSGKVLDWNIRDAVLGAERSLENIQEYVDFDHISQQIQATQSSLEDPYLWMTNPGAASRAQSRLAELQHQLASRDRLHKNFKRLRELLAVAEAAEDIDLQAAVLLELQGLRRSADEFLTTLWLSRSLDQNSAYIDVRAGSDSTEACDWAARLVRMYTKWAQSRKFAVKTVDETPGYTAGPRATTLLVEGRYAYGYAQYESGLHALTSAAASGELGTRPAAIASVRVLPYIDEDDVTAGVELDPADFKITNAADEGAKNGQTTPELEKAVRVVHVPTGLTVTCQSEPSEHQNRVVALSLLRSKLYDAELQKRARSESNAHSALQGTPQDTPIRVYTLEASRVVKDLRTGYEMSSDGVQKVLDGDLDRFMEASLRKFRKKP
ncbi:release factor [Cubamyces sp. BRFM 1775]|nr:release factor [Cubamyces sp. BRFM 1775]